MPLIYDPEMTNEDNHILDEIHDLTDSGYLYGCAVFPTELGDDGLPTAFYEDDLVVSLSIDDGSTWHPAVLFRDYTFGPIHLRASVACSRNIYSNIIVYNHGDKLVRISYRGLGDHADTTYLQEITSAGVFDRDDPALWLSFSGQAKNIDASQVDTGVAGQTPLEVLNTFLGKIIGLMTGAGEISPVLMDLIQEMVGDLEAWKNEIINSIPTGGGGGGGGEPLAEKLVLLSGRPSLSTHLGTQVAESLIGNNVTILTALQNIDAAVRAFKTQVINTSFVNGVTEILPYAGGITLNTTAYFRRAILKDGSRYRYNYETLIPEYVLTGNWEADKLMLIGLDGSANHVTVHTSTTKQEPLQSWIEDREVFEKQVFDNTIKAQLLHSPVSGRGPVMLSSSGFNTSGAGSPRRFAQRFSNGLYRLGFVEGSVDQPHEVVNACQGKDGDLYVYRKPTGSGTAGISGCIRRYLNVFSTDVVSSGIPPFTVFQHPSRAAAASHFTLTDWGANAFGDTNPIVNPATSSHDLVSEMHADPLGNGLYFSTYYSSLVGSGNDYRIWHLDHKGTRRVVFSSSSSSLNKPECFTVDKFGNVYVACYNQSVAAASRTVIMKVTITRSGESWTLSNESQFLGSWHPTDGTRRVTALKITPKGHIYMALHGVNTSMFPTAGVVWLVSLKNPEAEVSEVFPVLGTYVAGAVAKRCNDAGYSGPMLLTYASSIGYMSKYPDSNYYPTSLNWHNHENMWAIRRLELDEYENCIFGIRKWDRSDYNGFTPAANYESAICRFHYDGDAPDGANAYQLHQESYPIDQFSIRPLGNGEFMYGVYRGDGIYSGTVVGYAAIAPTSDVFYTLNRGSGVGNDSALSYSNKLFGSVIRSGELNGYVAQRQWNPVRYNSTDGRNFQGCENPKIFMPCGPYELGGWGVKL